LPYYVTEGFDSDVETSTDAPDVSSTTIFDPATNEPDMQDAITSVPDAIMNIPDTTPDHSTIQATMVAPSETQYPTSLIAPETTHSNKGVFKQLLKK